MARTTVAYDETEVNLMKKRTVVNEKGGAVSTAGFVRWLARSKQNR
jgi:hypothetical protein